MENPIIKKQKRYLGDGDDLKNESLSKCSSSPQVADSMRITQRKPVERKNKHLGMLRQDLRRVKEKMKTLENTVIELKGKNLTTDEVSSESLMVII